MVRKRQKCAHFVILGLGITSAQASYGFLPLETALTIDISVLVSNCRVVYSDFMLQVLSTIEVVQ